MSQFYSEVDCETRFMDQISSIRIQLTKSFPSPTSDGFDDLLRAIDEASTINPALPAVDSGDSF